ncbi:MAG TPA: type II toxin-antitoxin system HicB family antitoxin [Stellaceae bacterium]
MTCPSLPPVVTYGEMLDEAREKVREAIELCLDVMEEEGKAIPPPDRDPRRAVDELVSVTVSRG